MWTLILVAQGYNPDRMPAGKLKKYGLSALDIGDPYTAVDLLGKFVELKPDNDKVRYYYADALRQSRNYAEAEKQYQVVNDNQPDNYLMAYYYKGAMQKVQGKYKEAEASFKEFRKKYKTGKDAKAWRILALDEIKGIEQANYIIDSIPLNVDIRHLNRPINRAHQEQAPIYYRDSLMIFTSLQIDTSIYYFLSDTTREAPVRQLHLAQLVDTTWQYVSKFPGPFNVEHVNTGNGSFSPDGQRFYFTRCETDDVNKTICHIYVSKNEQGNWQEPKLLEGAINLANYSSTHPAIGIYSRPNRPDKEIIYFTSDRPEGRGGTDIWYALYNEREDNFFEPRVLSSRINTKGNEITPYYDNTTKTLYYSSDEEPGLGGMDIFKSTGQRSKWTNPENIGSPINSGYDDQYFVVNKNQKEGFFTSNRPGGIALKNETCCDDIYTFKFRDQVDINVVGTFFENLDTDVKLADLQNLPTNSLENIFQADVAVLIVDEENGIDIPVATSKTDNDGSFDVTLQKDKKYKIFLSKSGYLSKEIEINTHNITASKTIKRNAVTIKVPDKPIRLENIYYDFDKWDLTVAAKASIDTTLLVVLNENPNIVIELSSHTDSRGADHYNQSLSQRRAVSVVNYLIAKGINVKRLVGRGYGESKPVAPNENPDGSDNPEGRAMNRRTEFRILRTDFVTPVRDDEE